MEYITKISGPVSLSIYHFNSVRYYFFGDTHFNDTNRCQPCGSDCIDFVELLHAWLNYNNHHGIQTDLFLESSFTKNEEVKRTDLFIRGTMVDVINSFNPCLSKNKQYCVYLPHVHVHYANIRLIKEYNNIYQADPFNIKRLIQFYKTKQIDLISFYFKILNDLTLYIEFYIQHVEDILNAFLQPDGFDDYIRTVLKLIENFEPELKSLILNQLTNQNKLIVIRNNQKMHRVAAELQKLSHINPEMAQLIYQFALFEMKDIVSLQLTSLHLEPLEKINQQLMKPKPPDITKWGTKSLIYYLEQYQKSFVSLSGLIMDVYTLARMFYYNQDEVIIFAGHNHINRYNDFFQLFLHVDPVLDIGMTHIDSTLKHNEGVNRCLYHEQLPNYLPIALYNSNF